MSISVDIVEQAITWNAYRAVAEAMKKAGEIASDTGDMMVEVQINVVSDSFPGTHESGRSRSRRAGYAICIYTQKEPQP